MARMDDLIWFDSQIMVRVYASGQCVSNRHNGGPLFMRLHSQTSGAPATQTSRLWTLYLIVISLALRENVLYMCLCCNHLCQMHGCSISLGLYYHPQYHIHQWWQTLKPFIWTVRNAIQLRLYYLTFLKFNHFSFPFCLDLCPWWPQPCLLGTVLTRSSHRVGAFSHDNRHHESPSFEQLTMQYKVLP